MFRYLWKSLVSSKAVAFSWKLFHDRIPTRSNYSKKNVLDPNISINGPLCGDNVETLTHLFLHCHEASNVWFHVLKWLNFGFITSQNLFARLECWRGDVRDRKLQNDFWLIYHGMIWFIWRTQNDWFLNILLR